MKKILENERSNLDVQIAADDKSEQDRKLIRLYAASLKYSGCPVVAHC